MKLWLAKAAITLSGVLIVIQFVPVARTNPPVESEIQVAPELEAIFRRACYDCHSNETVWPWYSHVAPVSFLITHDVKEGRGELNFSLWDQYDTQRKTRKLKEMAEQITKGKMPQWYYALMHPQAELSTNDKSLILKWAEPPH